MLRLLIMSVFMFAGLVTASVALAADGQTYRFFTQGGLVYGEAKPGESVTLNGEPVKVAPDGRYVIGFSRDESGPQRLTYIRPDGSVRAETEVILDERTFNIERVDGLPPKTVTPPPEWRARRQVEIARVVAARRPVTDAMDWAAGFIKPAEGRYSGFYGSQRILNGQPRSPHYGLDIAAETGTPVVAPAGGIVRLADPDFLLEGGIVIIDHGFGVSSTLFHMDTVSVEEGARIEQGDSIGTIGATGRASGPHVDWRINWGSKRLDPGLVMGLDP